MKTRAEENDGAKNDTAVISNGNAAKPEQQTVGGGGGRTLSEPSPQPSSSHVETSRTTTAIELPPEPDGVCNI